MNSRATFGLVSIGVIIVSVGVAVWLGFSQFQEARESNLPIAPVRQGEFVVVIRCRGVVQAERSAQVYAPLIPNLRIVWMAPSGDVVQQGEPVIRFDSSSAGQELIQKQTALEQAEATLAQAIVDARITAEQDETRLRDLRFEVQMVELRTVNSEFISRIEAEQNRINLKVAQQNLRALEAEVAQHVVANESKMASLTRKKEQAEAEIGLTRARLAGMEIPASLTGYPIYSTNPTQLMQTSSQPYRIGDTASPGVTLAVIPDLASLYMDVTVEEADRGRMTPGDDVIIRIDALPEMVTNAKLTGISPLAEFSMDTSTRSFHVYAALDAKADARLRPGMNGGMDVVIKRIPNAIAIPSQALFTRGGKPAVYIVEDGGYRLVEVEVLARNPDEVAISGIPGDARVALADPNVISDTGSATEGN